MSHFGWDTLQKHRDLARFSMMYRVVHKLVDIPVQPYPTPLTSLTRGHDSRFHQIRTSNTTYQQSFFPRTIILWNQLSQTACQTTLLFSTVLTFSLLYMPLLSIACGHSPAHCENTQVLREAITAEEDDDELYPIVISAVW